MVCVDVRMFLSCQQQSLLCLLLCGFICMSVNVCNCANVSCAFVCMCVCMCTCLCVQSSLVSWKPIRQPAVKILTSPPLPQREREEEASQCDFHHLASYVHHAISLSPFPPRSPSSCPMHSLPLLLSPL